MMTYEPPIPVALPALPSRPCLRCGTLSLTQFCADPMCRSMQDLLLTHGCELARLTEHKPQTWLKEAAALLQHAVNGPAVQRALIAEMTYQLYPETRPKRISEVKLKDPACVKCHRPLPEGTKGIICAYCLPVGARGHLAPTSPGKPTPKHPRAVKQTCDTCFKPFQPPFYMPEQTTCRGCRRRLNRHDTPVKPVLPPTVCPCGTSFPTFRSQRWCPACLKLSQHERRQRLGLPIYRSVPTKPIRCGKCKQSFIPATYSIRWCPDCRANPTYTPRNPTSWVATEQHCGCGQPFIPTSHMNHNCPTCQGLHWYQRKMLHRRVAAQTVKIARTVTVSLV